MESLNGLVALVTGCARYSGIGRGVALAIAEAGGSLSVCDVTAAGTRNQAEPQAQHDADWGLTSLVDELVQLGTPAHSAIGDVSVKADADRMIAETVERFGRLDILVNNAGAPQGADRGWSWEVPEHAFDEQLRINTKGTFLMSVAAVRAMLGQPSAGRIINISSLAGRVGLPQRTAYSASKFAIIGLTQSMAAELADRNITVNAVCPGPMATDRNAASRARATASEDAGAATVLGTPVGRIGVPADVARIVVFLASPEADLITGQTIDVNGGQDFR